MNCFTICLSLGYTSLGVAPNVKILKEKYNDALIFPYCKNWYGLSIERSLRNKSWTIVVLENGNLKIYAYKGKDVDYDTKRYEDFGRFKILAIFEGVKNAL